MVLLGIGKTKERWLSDALDHYRERLQPYAEVELHWVRGRDALLQRTARARNPICLDREGVAVTSPAFASLLAQKLEEGGTTITWVIGDADGLPEQLKAHYSLLSLSPLTFTHQCTRLLLLEQIYRAFEIIKGSPYHR